MQFIEIQIEELVKSLIITDPNFHHWSQFDTTPKKYFWHDHKKRVQFQREIEKESIENLSSEKICEIIEKCHSLVDEDARWLQFVPSSFKDRNIVIKAIQKNGLSLHYAPYRMKNDREIVMMAIEQCPISIKYASDILKNDREIAIKAIDLNPCALHYISFFLRKDKDIALRSIRKNGDNLQYADPNLKDNKEIVIEALRTSGKSIRHASERLQCDEELVLKAIYKNPHAICYIKKSILEKKEIMLEILGKRKITVQYIPLSLYRDKEIILKAIENSSNAFEFMISKQEGSIWLDNKEIVLKAIQYDKGIYDYLPLKLKNDREIISELIRHDIYLFNKVNIDMNQKEHILYFAKKNPELFGIYGISSWDFLLIHNAILIKPSLLYFDKPYQSYGEYYDHHIENDKSNNHKKIIISRIGIYSNPKNISDFIKLSIHPKCNRLITKILLKIHPSFNIPRNLKSDREMILFHNPLELKIRYRYDLSIRY